MNEIEIDKNYIMILQRIQEDYITIEKNYQWYKCKGGICTNCNSTATRIRYLIPKDRKKQYYSLCDECYDNFINTQYPLSELNM